MLDRRFKKYITLEQRNKLTQAFKGKFNNKEYLLFLRKFRGSMISKVDVLFLLNCMILLEFFLKKF